MGSRGVGARTHAGVTVPLDPDREVLARVAAGEVEVFGLLVERHQERLLRLCHRMLGEPEAARDAVQEVFVKAFRKAGAYRPRGQVFTWLYRIAVNHCLNRVRRRSIVRFLRLDGEGAEDRAPGPEPAAEGADPLAVLEARRRWQRTRRALARLPPGQRAVVVLARFEGLAHKEIAAALGITPGAVESRLVRAMRTLQAALVEEEPPGRAQEARARGVPPRGGGR